MKEKDKKTERRSSAEIRAELDGMRKLSVKAEVDLRNVEEAERNFQGQKRKLHVAAAEGDRKSSDKRAEINKQLWTLQTDKADIADTVVEVDSAIQSLEAELARVERSEAADRILSERYPVMQAKAERLDVLFTEAVKVIDELKEIGRLNMADAAVVHPGHVDIRRFNPVWNLIDAVRWRFGALLPREIAPEPMFRKPLAKLTRDGLEAARGSLTQSLRGSVTEDQANKKEASNG